MSENPAAKNALLVSIEALPQNNLNRLKQLNQIKDHLKRGETVNEEKKGGFFQNVGELFSIVNDAKSCNIEDARLTKEIFQKAQLLEILVLILIFTGNMFLVLAVFPLITPRIV